MKTVIEKCKEAIINYEQKIKESNSIQHEMKNKIKHL